MSKPAYKEALDLLCRKLLEDEARFGVTFPYVTKPSGEWDTMLASVSAGYAGANWSHGNWFCGFWVGLLSRRASAQRRCGLPHAWPRNGCAWWPRAPSDGNTHDIGFIFYSSAKVAFHVTGEPTHRALALAAAERLRARTIVTDRGAYISAWGPLTDARGRRSAAIDTMANIPLLYWAAHETGDDSYRLAAEAHALSTQRDFVRADQSILPRRRIRAARRDAARVASPFRAMRDESCWSRGQAWAIYGFVASYAATGRRAHLQQAERLAEYWARRAGDDPVPFWDFDDPAIPAAPRDSAAAAITASALLDMAALHWDAKAAARWRALAEATLDALCLDYLARDPAHRGLLRHGCYSKPHSIGADAAVLFGDFYFVEALCTAVMPGRFRPLPDIPTEQAA